MTSTKAWGESCAKPTLRKATRSYSQDMLITQYPIPSNVSSLNCWPMLLGRVCRGKRDSAECSALPAKDFLTRADTVKYSAKRNWNVPAQLLSLTRNRATLTSRVGAAEGTHQLHILVGLSASSNSACAGGHRHHAAGSVWSAKLTLPISTGLELGRRGGGSNTQMGHKSLPAVCVRWILTLRW